MQRALLIQLLVGLLIGGGLGAALGYYGKCTTGTCPLTANPWRGGFIGALIGGIFAFSAGSPKARVAEAGEHASLQIASVEEFEQYVLKVELSEKGTSTLGQIDSNPFLEPAGRLGEEGIVFGTFRFQTICE